MELTIEKLVYGGDGLARLAPDNRGRRKAVFVPFVLEGERVQADLAEEKTEFAYAHLQQVLSPSPARVAPQCPYFFRCGGCHYQHGSYEHQLQIKGAVLKENLTRVAKLPLEAELQVHASPPWNYRNRTRLRVRTQPEFVLGYYRFGSHALLSVEQCPISSPLINRAIGVTWELGRSGKMDGAISEIEFFANADDTQLQIEFYGPGRNASVAATRLANEFQENLPEVVGVTWSGQQNSAESAPPRRVSKPELLLGSEQLIYKTAHAPYRVSAGAFFQVNRFLPDELISIVTYGQAGRLALDLYAGVGLFSVVLKRNFERVIAVEASQISHSDLEHNAHENVHTVHATSEDYLKSVHEDLRPDLIVVDPPRGGLGKTVAQAVRGLRSRKIIYVSCDPATLARDLRLLHDGGYRVQQAHLIDLFPQTYHIESVFHLGL